MTTNTQPEANIRPGADITLTEPTQTPPEVPATKPKNPTIADVLNAVKALNTRIDGIEEKKAEQEYKPKPLNSVSSEGVHIPMEYQEIVRTILNGKFQVDLGYSTDTASFSFSILVPQEYSNASKSHWDMYHEDRRSRVILNALGVNGVREWVQKVYESFDMETRSRIANDRAQLV